MTLKEFIELVKASGKCAIGALLILIVGGIGAGLWLWDQKDKLDEGNKILLKDKAEFYKEQSAAAVQRAASDGDLGKRESEIKGREKAYEQDKKILDDREAALAENQSKMQGYASVISFAAQQSKAREQISQLMSEFSSLGVRIGDHPKCGDAEGWKKYNQATAIVSSIRGLAVANSMEASYQAFIKENSSNMSISCPQ
jgi:hypothetical protein